MKHVRHLVQAILIGLQMTLCVAQATPLATFETVTAQRYVNFPIRSEDADNPPFRAGGILMLSQPTEHIWALDHWYKYEYSLIAYFDFIYGFVGDHGETVLGQEFSIFFDSPHDYINLGRIPAYGLASTQAFTSTDLINAFNEKFHGLQDNVWWIYGFRASVRHIYDLPEPGTLFLVGVGLAALLYARRLKQ